MSAYFSWNGALSTSYGIFVRMYPDIIIPEERVTTKKIFGRSGTVTMTEGAAVYEEFIAGVDCGIRDITSLANITQWLRGAGAVIFGNHPTGYYKARIANQIELAKILRGHNHRSFIVNFRCQPYFYHLNVSNTTITTSGGTITNPGNVASEPVITVTGSGDVSLMVGLTIITLTGMSGSVILDCARKEAYKMAGDIPVSQNSIVTASEYPTLAPGVNGISWTGSVSSVVISPAWRDI